MTPPPTPDAAGVEPTFREPPADAAEPPRPPSTGPTSPPRQPPSRSPSPATASPPRSTTPAELARRGRGAAPRAPGRSRSTPSGPPATATASAAYLVQLRRADVGTVLIDPRRRCPTSAALGAAIADDEWVLHAASQDLPCLAELGLRADAGLRHRAGRPAARLRPKVGLGSIVEEVLGLHAWRRATRPPTGRPGRCPSPGCATRPSTSRCWSSCATCWPPSSTSRASASWAEQEFAAIVAAPPTPPRVDPWRRTSGLHRVRKRRQLAVVRALWERRDEVARRRDIAPGRVLPDRAIVAAALAPAEHRGRAGRAARLGRALAAPADRDLAAGHRRGPGAARTPSCPSPRRRTTGRRRRASGRDRDPAAAARLAAARAAVGAIAERARPAGREPARARTPSAGCAWDAARRTPPTPRSLGRRPARRYGARAVAGRARPPTPPLRRRRWSRRVRRHPS